jgi:hypothetical protein
MKNVVMATGLLILLLFSCEKEEENSGAYEDLVISTRYACGWCGGLDSLIITKNDLYYCYYNFCFDSVHRKNETTGADEWEDLVDAMDLNEFLKLNMDRCNICADGCDTWINIETDTVSHSIRFGYQDSAEIIKITPFIEKLDDIKVRLRNN